MMMIIGSQLELSSADSSISVKLKPTAIFKTILRYRKDLHGKNGEKIIVQNFETPNLDSRQKCFLHEIKRNCDPLIYQ